MDPATIIACSHRARLPTSPWFLLPKEIASSHRLRASVATTRLILNSFLFFNPVWLRNCIWTLFILSKDLCLFIYFLWLMNLIFFIQVTTSTGEQCDAGIDGDSCCHGLSSATPCKWIGTANCSDTSDICCKKYVSSLFSVFSNLTLRSQQSCALFFFYTFL